MAQGGHDWQSDPAFAELDESWVENNATAAVGAVAAAAAGSSSSSSTKPLQERNSNILTEEALKLGSKHNDQLRSSSSSSSSSTSKHTHDSLTLDGKVTSFEEAALAPIYVKKRNSIKHRRGSGGATDSELILQAGPSSPSQNKPSHRRSASEQALSASDDWSRKEEQVDLKRDASLSPPLSSGSKFSVGSGEKRGSHTGFNNVIDKDAEEVEEEEDHFGSAREDQSMTLGMTTAAEVTCIEHSNIDSDVNVLNQMWKNAKRGKLAGADLLNLPKSKLRSMFDGMGDDMKLAEQPLGQVEEQQQQWEADKVEEDKNHEGDDVKVAKEEVDDQTEMLEPPSEEEKEEEEGEGEDGGDGEEEEEEEEDDDDVWEDIEHKRTVSSEQEEKETEKLLPQVPQCNFTFSSPVAERSHFTPPLATPSGSHGLLRLLPRGTRDAEIEQILNTPRSGKAGKFVNRLVEQERGEREKKRLRVDMQPTGQTNLAKYTLSEELPRDYVRDAPAFMERLKSIRLPSDASSRSSVSSIIINRRGAKAPTPETSLLRGGRPLRALAKGQSPRKILRLWSAANQVDEELEEEESKEAEAAEAEWQDILDRSPEAATSPSNSRIPIVSVDPPTQRGLESIVNGAKETWQPGMLHIGPEDVNTRDLEDLAKGRMTFDRAMGKWIPARDFRRETNQGESSDEASDPFQDIESLTSQSMIKRIHVHAPKSQSALRNEVQVSDTSASSSLLDVSRTTLQETPPESNLLSAPKTPKPPPLSHRSPTPRSILKTGRSLLTPDGNPSPMSMRQEPRSISFAEHGHHDHHHHQTVSKERVEKVEDLLRQLAELALGPDDTSMEMLTRQETPTRKINFNPAASVGTRSPWNLSTLKAKGGAEDWAGNASFLTNASFNIAHDRILELITDVAPWEPGWQNLKSIDLSKRRVDSLVRLKDFLPLLEEAILDDNEISYLTGLPSSLRLLSISSNRLPPTVSFGHLINLEFLDISDNHIDDSLMSLRQLVHLRHLRVENNHVRSLEGIEHLPKLETLNLRKNQLQAINIASHQWPRLKDLILSHNQIVTVRGINHLRHLRSLNLDHNRLSRIDLGVRMSRLKQLRLSGNVQLSSLDVGPAVNLRTLYADDCSLEEVLNLNLLEKLDNLSLRQQNGDGNGINWPAHQTRDIKRLFLSGNAFRSIDLTNRASLGTAPVMMTKFYSMVYLELSACQLSSLPLDLADLIPNVRHLNADYNLFETLPNLSNLQRLKRFSIIGCRIAKSRKVVESLDGCDELAVLDIRMNPCTMGLYPPILLTTPHKGIQVNKAFLPPIPNPTIARPDLHHRGEAESQSEAMKLDTSGLMHQSFFHKRGPAPDLSYFSTRGEEEKEVDDTRQRNNAIFVTSDNRFFRTLPAQYRLQRLLHRGALAMACPNLTWLDGLLVDEAEVQQADEYFRARLQADNSSCTGTSESNSDSI